MPTRIRKRKNSLFPHNGMTPDASYAVGTGIPVSDIDRDADCFFTCTLVVTSGDSGVIVEVGGSTFGLLAGINGDGDLVVRYGSASSPPILNGCRIVIGSGLIPKNKRIDLSFSVDFSDVVDSSDYREGIIVWIDGHIVGRAEMAGSLTDWSEIGDGGFGLVDGTIPTETGITTAYDGTLIGSLKYFKRRASPYGSAG